MVSVRVVPVPFVAKLFVGISAGLDELSENRTLFTSASLTVNIVETAVLRAVVSAAIWDKLGGVCGKKTVTGKLSTVLSPKIFVTVTVIVAVPT